MKVNLYGVLPTEIRYNRKLHSSAKLMYAEITACVTWEGVCDEDIEHFVKVLECDRRSVYRYLRQLEDAGVIERGNKEIRLPSKVPQQSLSTDAKQPDTGLEEFSTKFLCRFESAFNTVLDKKESYFPVIQQRLLYFSESELERALENRIRMVAGSGWHQLPENRASVLDIMLLLKDDATVLKYLNMKLDAPEEVQLKPLKFD